MYLLSSTWDLAVDSSGNIAMAMEPYALAQDAASSIQTYLGEVYLDTTIGIPYSSEILGYGVPLELFREQAILAAMTVPDVASTQVFFTGLSNRVLTGQVQITSISGQTVAIAINSSTQSSNIFTLDQSNLDGTALLG